MDHYLAQRQKLLLWQPSNQLAGILLMLRESTSHEGLCHPWTLYQQPYEPSLWHFRSLHFSKISSITLKV